MLKSLTIAAFAVVAVSAFAQDGMMMDAKAMKPKELMSFLEKDTYKKLNAPDAYIITSFLQGLPGNYQTALSRSLVAVAQEAKEMGMENQTAANSMAPMGDMMPPMEPSGFKNFQSGDRDFKTAVAEDEDVVSRLSPEEVEELFSLEHHLRHAAYTLTAVGID